MLSARQNHQNLQNFHFLENSNFFDRFETFQDARMVLILGFLMIFGPPIRQIRKLGVPNLRSQPN